jgi:hypothetical protein
MLLADGDVVKFCQLTNYDGATLKTETLFRLFILCQREPKTS